MKAKANHGGVAAGEVAFEAVALVTEEEFCDAPAHSEFSQPVRGFIADGTETAGVDDAALEGGDVPVETELGGGVGAGAGMMKVVADGGAPIEVVQPGGADSVDGGITVGKVPAQSLQPDAR